MTTPAARHTAGLCTKNGCRVYHTADGAADLNSLTSGSDREQLRAMLRRLRMHKAMLTDELARLVDRMLRERDAEIGRLRAEIGRLRAELERARPPASQGAPPRRRQ